MVFGTPMTARVRPWRPASSAIRCAPRSVPSPPMTNSTLMPCRRSVATIVAGPWSPREVPRMAPPWLGMPATTAWGTRTGPAPPPVTRAEPEDVADAVVVRQLQDQAADDVVQPGGQAAAGDDPHPGGRRVEEDALPGPARLQGGQVRDRMAAPGRAGQRVIQE